MSTPDITKAQAVAIVQALIALVVAFGLDVSPEARDAIVQLATVLAAVLPLADAGVRRKRAEVVRAEVEAMGSSPLELEGSEEGVA